MKKNLFWGLSPLLIAVIGEFFSIGVASTMIGVYTMFFLYCFTSWQTASVSNAVVMIATAIAVTATLVINYQTNPWGVLGFTISGFVYLLLITGGKFEKRLAAKAAGAILAVIGIYLTFLTPAIWWSLFLAQVMFEAIRHDEKEENEEGGTVLFLPILIFVGIGAVSMAIEFHIWNPIWMFITSTASTVTEVVIAVWPILLSFAGVWGIFWGISKIHKIWKKIKDEKDRAEKHQQAQKKAAQEEEERRKQKKLRQEKLDNEVKDLLEKSPRQDFSWEELYKIWESSFKDHLTPAMILHNRIEDGAIFVSQQREKIIFEERMIKFFVENLQEVFDKSRNDEEVRQVIGRFTELHKYEKVYGFNQLMREIRCRVSSELWEKISPYKQ